MKELNTVEVQDVNGGVAVTAVILVAVFLIGFSDGRKQA